MSIDDLKRKIKTVLKNPKVINIKLLYLFSPMIGDKLYLKLLFPLHTGYQLDLKNPQTYNQKLQWLKLNYRKPIMTKMVDKFEAKDIVKKIVGEQYVVRNYGVWNTFDEIDFDSLPNQFVLKTTHDQGGVVICKDKLSFDYNAAREKLNKHLKTKHYFLSREWPYKNVPPRILAEEYLNVSQGDFKDYKFYCFHGQPKVMYISKGKEKGVLTLDFYDMNFNLLDIERPVFKNSKTVNIKPINFDLMIDLSIKLSKGFPHVRIDFYEDIEKLYIGEITFFQGGGLMPFVPENWDYKFGEWIDLEALKAEL